MKKLATITLTGALLLSAAAPASAHTNNVRNAQHEAAELAREVWLDDDSLDYGWADCSRQSPHRVSCYAVNDYAGGLECWTRVTVQMSRASYRYSVSYGRTACF